MSLYVRKDAFTYRSRARTYIQLGRTKEAQNDLVAALEAEPASRSAVCDLSYIQRPGVNAIRFAGHLVVDSAILSESEVQRVLAKQSQ